MVRPPAGRNQLIININYFPYGSCVSYVVCHTECLQEVQHEVPGGIQLDWMGVEFKERMDLLRQTAQAVVAKKLDLQKHAAMHARKHQRGGGGPGPQDRLSDRGELPMDAGGGAAPSAPGSTPTPAPAAAEMQQQQLQLAALPVAYPVTDAADIAHGAPGGSGQGARW